MIYWGTTISVFMICFMAQAVIYIYYTDIIKKQAKARDTWTDDHETGETIISFVFYALFLGTSTLTTGLSLKWMGF